MIEIVLIIAGIIIGMTIRQEHLQNRFNKTYEQLDKEMRDQLNYYRNLSDSLREDVKSLRIKIKLLEKK